MRAPPSWPKHLSKAHLLIPSLWGLCFNTWMFWRWDAGGETFRPQQWREAVRSKFIFLNTQRLFLSTTLHGREAASLGSCVGCARLCVCLFHVSRNVEDGQWFDVVSGKVVSAASWVLFQFLVSVVQFWEFILVCTLSSIPRTGSSCDGWLKGAHCLRIDANAIFILWIYFTG